MAKDKTKKKATAFKGTTHLAAILDRSGSMAPLIDEMISGYNHWLAQQQALPGAALLTTTIFDTAFDLVGAAATPVKQAPLLTSEVYFARYGTALNDAVGKTVSAMKDAVKETDRALVLIVTDGQENSSREWSSDQVKKLITELEGNGNWSFAYLSSAPSAWADAKVVGTQSGSTLTYVPSAQGAQSMWATMDTATAAFRGSTASASNAVFAPPENPTSATGPSRFIVHKKTPTPA